MATVAVTAGLIGTHICIGTLTATCSKMVEMTSLVSKLVTNSNYHYRGLKELDKVLKKTDLEARVTVINGIVSVLDNSNAIVNDKSKFPTPIQECLKQLHEVITDINSELTNIHEMCDYHETKWCYTWRWIDFSIQIENIEEKYKILEFRFDSLIKAITAIRSMG